MTYNVLINIRTEPDRGNTEMYEEVNLRVEAENYADAKKKTFNTVKSAKSFEDLMDKTTASALKYEDNEE